KEAAENLAKLIVLYDAVIVVAHSHGATVGIIASKILGLQYSGRNFYGKIAKFYALGVPVDPTGLLYPDMSVIDKFYNLFSFGDQIQRVHGIYNRCFGPHDRMTNIAVMLDQLHPSHTALHDPAVGKYLLMIPGVLQKSGVGNFHIYRDADPAQISFFRSSCPQYALQPDQNSLLDLDVRAFQLMQMAFMRSPNRYPDSSI
ncbi:MAG TPA: hypothetical protein VGE32_16055, partial [Cellvibrio sp.]